MWQQGKTKRTELSIRYDFKQSVSWNVFNLKVFLQNDIALVLSRFMADSNSLFHFL